MSVLTGCTHKKLLQDDSGTVEVLKQMILPGVGMNEPSPITEVIQFVDESCRQYSNHFELIRFTVEESALNGIMTNRWSTLSGRRRTAYEYLETIAETGYYTVLIEKNSVRISSP